MDGFILQQQNNSNKQRKKLYCVTFDRALLQYHFFPGITTLFQIL